jgi:hypothetical protein
MHNLRVPPVSIRTGLVAAILALALGGCTSGSNRPSSADVAAGDRWQVIGGFEHFNEVIEGQAWYDDRKDEIHFALEGTQTRFKCIGPGEVTSSRLDANGCRAIKGDLRLLCGVGREIIGSFDHNSCQFGFAAGMDTLTGSTIALQFDLSSEQLGMQSKILATRAGAQPDLLEAQEYLDASGFTDEIYGFGTGFAITADGIILTAAHVVEDEYGVQVRSGSQFATADIMAIDIEHDLALLKTDLRFEPLSLMTADPEDEEAVPVKAIGYRFTPRSEPVQNAVLSMAMSMGRLHVYAFPGDIIPGYSGGPVVTLPQHKVVGVIYGLTVQYHLYGWNEYDIEKIVIATDRKTIFDFLEKSLDAGTMAEIVARSDADQRVKPFDVSDSIVLVTVY